MSMMDYGAIAFKNGKLISTEMFTPMIDMVGWEDCEEDICCDYNTDEKRPLRLNGNYYAYIGDKDYTIAFYKTYIRVVELVGSAFYSQTECMNGTYFTWSKWERWLNGYPLTVTKRNGYYVCRWRYKGDKYKVYFGYGVDFQHYKRWRIVNYYRSPIYVAKRIWRDIERYFKRKRWS